MPRKYRLPEGMLRRCMLAGGIFLPFVLYALFRFLPITRPSVLHLESNVARFTTRVGNAMRYVFLHENTQVCELALCEVQRNDLAQDIAHVLAADIGPLRTLPVQVVARGYGGDPQDMLVWKTDEEPFVLGEMVGAGKILFGVVLEAKDDLGVVRPITHEKSAIPGMILGKESVVGVVSGTGGAWLEFSYVPKGSNVEVGDTVVTSGLGGGIPRGFLFGIVREVIDADPSPFYRVTVEPLVESMSWWEGEVLHVPVL